jgi:hypothetical protein
VWLLRAQELLSRPVVPLTQQLQRAADQGELRAVLPLPLPPLLLLLLLPLLLPLELDPARLGLGRLGAGRQPVLRALLADLGVLPRCAEPLVSKKNQVPLLLLEYPLTYLPLTDLRGAAAAPAA